MIIAWKQVILFLGLAMGVLICSNVVLAQSRPEHIELTCQGNKRGRFAERVLSRAFGKDSKIEQNMRCNRVLTGLLDSGLELTDVSRHEYRTTYTFEGSGFNIVLGSDEPVGPSADINCNPSSSDHPWTCKCDTAGDCLYLELFCTHAIENYYQCDEDESSNAGRVERAISSFAGGHN